MDHNNSKDFNENMLIDVQTQISEHEEKLQNLFITAVEKKDKAQIKLLAEEIHPVDLSLILEDFEEEDLDFVLNVLDDKMLALILEQCEEEILAVIMPLITSYRTLYLFNYMSKDDIVDILGTLPLSKRKEIINLMKTGERKVIEALLGYAQDTAGGIMTTEYIALKGSLTISQTIEKIREIAPKTEVIDTIFILSQNWKLIGTVDLRDIFTATSNQILSDIMDDHIITVYPETDQEEVSLLVSKYNLKTIAVINQKGGLLGIITVDDIIDIMVQEHTEDILKLGGVSKEESINSTTTQSIKMRLPWLLVNLITAFVASFTVSIFEGTIEKVAFLAAAMPIIAGMGGNSGTQTLSIIIRSITLGEVSLKDCLHIVRKEVVLAVVNGGITGLLTGIILFVQYQNPYLGIIIFISMILNLIIAGIFGVIVPLILKALKLDPAIASTVFLTTATDVFGFFVFLGLAQMFLPYLL
ncbi:MAG: magnesium transporter [Clostridia bacterium]